MTTLSPEERRYIASEQFIWDELIIRASAAVQSVREQWRRKHKFPRSLIAFLSEPVKTTDGSGLVIQDLIFLVVPDGNDINQEAKRFAKATGAYALLAIERAGDQLKILLESHHGTRSWVAPINRHGDVEVLGKENASKNTESLGALWRHLPS